MDRSMLREQRYLENPYADFDGQGSLHFFNESVSPTESNGYQRLRPDSHLGIKIQTTCRDLLERIHEAYFLQKEPNRNVDCSVYTGICGVYFLYQEIGRKWDESLLFECLHSPSLTPFLGFLCGISGPLAFAAAYSAHKNTYLKSFLSLQNSKLFADSPEEYLYGKAGYLYALLLVRREHPRCKEIDEIIAQTASIIIQKGVFSSPEYPTLHYKWYEEEYLGAAHGYAGILTTLLRARSFLNPQQLKVVVEKLNELARLQLFNGNFPPSFTTADDDRLVHWCHGAPGFAELYFHAYVIFEDPKYLRVGEECLEAIWRRGLLKKGFGLCHGSAGNGYAFLLAYKATKDPKHLYRALRFAEWCTSFDNPLCQTPDNPYSLFEGLAGTLFFLHHVQQSADKVHFPCYTF